jgi:hypothetical protein
MSKPKLEVGYYLVATVCDIPQVGAAFRITAFYNHERDYGDCLNIHNGSHRPFGYHGETLMVGGVPHKHYTPFEYSLLCLKPNQD